MAGIETIVLAQQRSLFVKLGPGRSQAGGILLRLRRYLFSENAVYLFTDLSTDKETRPAHRHTVLQNDPHSTSSQLDGPIIP